MTRAGSTNSQPTRVCRRIPASREIRRSSRRRADESVARGHPPTRPSPVSGMGQRASSFAYSAWTAFSRPAASCLPPTIFWSSGVQPWAKIEPGRVGDEVHRPIGLGDIGAGGERLVGDRAGRSRRDRQVRGTAGVRATDGDVDLAGGLVGGDPVEEEGGAIGVLGRVARCRTSAAPTWRPRIRQPRPDGKTKKPTLPGEVLVVDGVLPVAIEHEDALALAEAGIGVGVLDRVRVLREVAGLDPLLRDAARP